MRPHKEGITIIFSIFTGLLLVNVLLFFITPLLICYIFLGCSAIICFFILQFFRNPKRPVITNDNIVLCPADGKIVAIENIYEPEYFNNSRILISVFMSPLNVHVNRYPVNGIVKYFKYHAGKYFVAYHPKSSLENERTTVIIQKSDGTEIMVRQIAGIIARRIVCYAKENTAVKQGEELGFIKFGSRVDIFLPTDAQIMVKLHQKVKANITQIARYYKIM
ncbi:MAG: phosphatidylserine decarboxylase family protein [Bacteroidia bacterium]|nr:phosphatidylserine decarboxylase family protein [Bacteroidia bacterium]